MNKNSIWSLLAAAAVGIAAIGCAKAGEGDSTGTGDNSSSSSSSSGSSAKRPAVSGTGNAVSGDTIKIGIVASLNGDQKPWGDDSVGGAKIAVEEINAAGGIDGKKVELLIGDSNSNPEQGKSACEKLISDGCIGILGEVASGITIQMAKSAFEKGVPVVAIGATKDEVTDEGNNIFRVCYIDSFQGPVMAEFAYKDLGLRNVAIMTDKKLPYSTGLSDNFRKHFEKLGGTIAVEEFYEQKQTQFSAQLTNIKAKNPDGLFLSGYFPEVGPIARQAKDAGLNVKIMGGDGWDSTELINTGGEGIIGGYFCNHYNNKDTREEVQGFLSKWREKNGGKDPGTTMGALGYDGAALMIDALKRASAKKPATLNSAELLTALEETEGFKGVSGDISLKGMGGNPAKRALVVEVRPLPDGFVFKKAFMPEDLTK